MSDSNSSQTAPDTGKDWQAEAEKWKALARKHEEQAKANYEELQRLKAASDASKSEMDKLREQLAALEKRTAEAERKALLAEVAQAKGLTPAQARRLQGNTREELEADADDLLAAFGIARKQSESGSGDGKAAVGVFGRPKERLKPGAAPDLEPEPSPDDLADQVLKRARGI